MLRVDTHPARDEAHAAPAGPARFAFTDGGNQLSPSLQTRPRPLKSVRASGNPCGGFSGQHQRKVKNTQIYEFYHFPKNGRMLGMGLGTRDRTSNRTFSISVFHHRTNRPIPIPMPPNFFFAAVQIPPNFLIPPNFFLAAGQFFLRQIRKRHFFCGRTGSISVGVRFGVPTEPREASSVRWSYRTTVPKRYRKASLCFAVSLQLSGNEFVRHWRTVRSGESIRISVLVFLRESTIFLREVLFFGQSSPQASIYGMFCTHKHEPFKGRHRAQLGVAVGI